MATLSIDPSNHSRRFLIFQLTKNDHLTLKMASAQVVKVSFKEHSFLGL